jgi:hypothetical protein
VWKDIVVFKGIAGYSAQQIGIRINGTKGANNKFGPSGPELQ